jgi:hypothetical protein
MACLAHPLLFSKKDRERLNRARDFFGDPVQRWKDRLTLERGILEHYRSGRATVILECEFLGSVLQSGRQINNVNVEGDPVSHVLVEREETFNLYEGTFFVFKAYSANFQKLKHWDEKLVFVDDIHIVQSPEGDIPSLVGLYRFQYVLENVTGDLLLFESRQKGGFQFFPRIANWESRPLGRAYTNLEVQNVERTPKVGYNQTDVIDFSLFLDGNRVEVRREPSAHGHYVISDVLVGPFNLEP